MPAVLSYRNVLVAYDGSSEADLALEHAVRIGQAFNARIEIVAVVPPPSALAWNAPGGTRGLHEAMTAELDRALRAAVDALPDDVSVSSRLIDGDPAHELVRAARDGEHDLIVLGSRGRGRVASALLGSVSSRVMHDAATRVLVIHEPHRGQPEPAASAADEPDLAA